MDIAKQVEYFKGLSYERQKAKVTEMLKQLEWTHEIFAMFYKTLIALPNVSKDVLTYLYQSILEIAEEIAVGNQTEAQNKIKNMAEVLMHIRKQEEMERVREGDPENLLKNI